MRHNMACTLRHALQGSNPRKEGIRWRARLCKVSGKACSVELAHGRPSNRTGGLHGSRNLWVVGIRVLGTVIAIHDIRHCMCGYCDIDVRRG